MTWVGVAVTLCLLAGCASAPTVADSEARIRRACAQSKITPLDDAARRACREARLSESEAAAAALGPEAGFHVLLGQPWNGDDWCHPHQPPPSIVTDLASEGEEMATRAHAHYRRLCDDYLRPREARDPAVARWLEELRAIREPQVAMSHLTWRAQPHLGRLSSSLCARAYTLLAPHIDAWLASLMAKPAPLSSHDAVWVVVRDLNNLAPPERLAEAQEREGAFRRWWNGAVATDRRTRVEIDAAAARVAAAHRALDELRGPWQPGLLTRAHDARGALPDRVSELDRAVGELVDRLVAAARGAQGVDALVEATLALAQASSELRRLGAATWKSALQRAEAALKQVGPGALAAPEREAKAGRALHAGVLARRLMETGSWPDGTARALRATASATARAYATLSKAARTAHQPTRELMLGRIAYAMDPYEAPLSRPSLASPAPRVVLAGCREPLRPVLAAPPTPGLETVVHVLDCPISEVAEKIEVVELEPRKNPDCHPIGGGRYECDYGPVKVVKEKLVRRASGHITARVEIRGAYVGAETVTVTAEASSEGKLCVHSHKAACTEREEVRATLADELGLAVARSLPTAEGVAGQLLVRARTEAALQRDAARKEGAYAWLLQLDRAALDDQDWSWLAERHGVTPAQLQALLP